MIAKVERMSDSPDNRPDLRISDIDRDRAAEVLREAHAQGRITVDELDERLTSVYNAKTFADLVPVTRDLPATQDAAAAAAPARRRIGGTPRFKLSLAILGGASRDGQWVVPPEYTAVATLGGIKLDMRDASFAEAETVIKAVAVMGRHGDHRARGRGGGGRRVRRDGRRGPRRGGSRCARGAADPHHRRRGDGRHRGQARPGPAIIPG